MSRFSGKSRAGAGAKGFASQSASSFGGFSSSSAGSRLSYLFEPPDFSSVPDPNVVVSLKNVLKKDSTTKARALEDLAAHVQAQLPEAGGVDEAVLDAWVQLYPRTAIDNSRRVRELSHTLLIDLLKSGRKRMERRIPKIVASWLAGTYDKDRVVARAATDGLLSFLSTEAKQLQLWKKCQPQILDYAIEAVQETPDSLSDERSTNKDDSDAKYYRVLSGGLSLVLGLLQRLDSGDIQVCQEEYDRFFSLDSVWKSTIAADAFVRRQCCQLLWLSLEKQESTLEQHIPKIGKTLVSEALKSSQTGSALEFVKVLTRLTKRHPEIWGTKKPPLSRVRPLLEKGSQGSPNPVSFWAALDQLLDVMPEGELTPEAASDFLRSARSGVSHRDEPRTGASAAWSFLLSAFQRVLLLVKPAESRPKLATDFIHPLIEHYIHPSSDRPPIGTATQLEIAAKAARTLSGSIDQTIVENAQRLWSSSADHLISRLDDSLQEADEDFAKTQKSLADEGVCFFSLLAATASGSEGDKASKLAVPAAAKLVRAASELLTKGVYRPFGAATILEASFQKCPFLFSDDGVLFADSLFPVNSPTQMQTLISSTSAPFLLSCLASFDSIPGLKDLFRSVWVAVVKSLLEHPDHKISSKYITRMVAHISAAPLARGEQALQVYLASNCLGCAQGSKDTWELVEACFTFDVLTEDVAGQIVKDMLAIFNAPNTTETEPALKALGIIAQRKPDLLSKDEDLHLALVTKLLALAETSNERVSSHAATVRLQLDTHGATDGGPQLMRIIQENLDIAGSASLAIDTLVQQAKKIAKMPGVSSELLFPSTTIWFEELALFLEISLNPSLSLTNDMRGIYYLASTTQSQQSREPQRDRKGLSVPARMALYTNRLLAAGFGMDSLPKEFQVELLCLLQLSALAVSDQMVLMEDNKLWATLSRPENLADAEELVSVTRRTLNEALLGSQHGNGENPYQEGLSGDLIKLLLGQANTLSPFAVYSARALCEIFQALAEKHGFRPAQHEQWISSLDVLKATPSTILPCAAILSGFGELLASSKIINTLLNRLISDIAGASVDSLKTFLTLILLNSCMPIFGADGFPVANNRLVFAVRQITSWFDEPDKVGGKTAAECCRALSRLLPNIGEVYGSYWENTLEFCKHLWARAAKDAEERRLPYIHASLKLVAVLESLEEPNEDLEDALKAFSEEKTSGLIRLLELQGDSSSQPAEIVNSLLCRQVDQLPPRDIAELSDVYGLVASTSRDIQRAAFTLLHRAIPRAQEKLSVDMVLEKTNVRLPDELMSLLLDPPTLEAFHDELVSGFPAPVRGYYLAWHLIFDAFSTASFPLRNSYAENLKTVNALEPMLNFTFDVLGHSAAHPLNLEKAQLTDDRIMSYDVSLAEAEEDERAMQWLLVHIYYLSLKYLPGLVKSWYINCRSKQTRIAVEAWTTRYFSPLTIGQTLEEVTKWAEEQEEPGEDEKELLVKVSKLSREVIAGYEVDELRASIAIRLPPAYPLEGVTVVGVNRVAVNERKWQSWIMTTQGVITFANGSIVDGLVAFRRNVVGALKGQSECVICYSHLDPTATLPTKKCGTCVNGVFHRSCLYKWFQTSNQNTCPLCRNPIDYLGASARRGRGDPYDAQ